VASIRTALGEIPADVLAATPDALDPPGLDTLNKHLVGGEYTLLHIVAHGAYNAKRDETALYFPKEGRRGPVTASELIERLSRLNVCRSSPFCPLANRPILKLNPAWAVWRNAWCASWVCLPCWP